MIRSFLRSVWYVATVLQTALAFKSRKEGVDEHISQPGRFEFGALLNFDGTVRQYFSDLFGRLSRELYAVDDDEGAHSGWACNGRRYARQE